MKNEEIGKEEEAYESITGDEDFGLDSSNVSSSFSVSRRV